LPFLLQASCSFAFSSWWVYDPTTTVELSLNLPECHKLEISTGRLNLPGARTFSRTLPIPEAEKNVVLVKFSPSKDDKILAVAFRSEELRIRKEWPSVAT
jgi:hypothetical protein